MELESLTDLARLSCAFERAPFPIFMSKEGSKFRLAVQTDLFMGIPIFYHIEVEKGGEFLAYRSSGEIEEAQLVEAALNPSFMYAPIVHILKLPRVLERSRGSSKVPSRTGVRPSQPDEDRLVQDALRGASSPSLHVQERDELDCGCFARLDDYEEASLFFYARSSTRSPPRGSSGIRLSRLATPTLARGLTSTARSTSRWSG